MIEDLIKKYPNDTDLGKAVREKYSPEMIKQRCVNCGKEFKGTVLIEICPCCYV